MEMPTIDLMALWRQLPAEDMALIRRIVKPGSYELRGSRPKLHDSAESRHAAYVWRMVVFMVSPNAQHHCIPTTCFWWLPADTDGKVMQRLNNLVNKITDTVPPEEWWGVRAWRGLADSDAAENRKAFMKGWKNDAREYLADSEARSAAV